MTKSHRHDTCIIILVFYSFIQPISRSSTPDLPIYQSTNCSFLRITGTRTVRPLDRGSWIEPWRPSRFECNRRTGPCLRGNQHQKLRKVHCTESRTYIPDAIGSAQVGPPVYLQHSTRSSTCPDPALNSSASASKRAEGKNVRWKHHCRDRRCRTRLAPTCRACTRPSARASMRPEVSLECGHARRCGPIRGWTLMGMSELDRLGSMRRKGGRT
jgi:hypothetical protein